MSILTTTFEKLPIAFSFWLDKKEYDWNTKSFVKFSNSLAVGNEFLYPKSSLVVYYFNPEDDKRITR